MNGKSETLQDVKYRRSVLCKGL